jgi:hypothetical protein
MTTLAFGTARECSTLLSLHPNSFLPFRWKALEHPELRPRLAKELQCHKNATVDLTVHLYRYSRVWNRERVKDRSVGSDATLLLGMG